MLHFSLIYSLSQMMMFVIFVWHRYKHYCFKYAVNNRIWIPHIGVWSFRSPLPIVSVNHFDCNHTKQLLVTLVVHRKSQNEKTNPCLSAYLRIDGIYWAASLAKSSSCQWRYCFQSLMISFCIFLVSENKVLCHPSSVDSLTTSAGTEDHVSMGGWAARKALRVVEHVEHGAINYYVISKNVAFVNVNACVWE